MWLYRRDLGALAVVYLLLGICVLLTMEYFRHNHLASIELVMVLYGEYKHKRQVEGDILGAAGSTESHLASQGD